MATRKRVWLNDPNLNYSNKRCLLVDADFINATNRLYEEPDTSFNYGDFVNASCVSLCPIAVLRVQPNYMVVFNESGEIESRWYSMKVEFISGEVTDTQSKWQITLLRDVIVDNRAAIAASVMRLNRGNQSNFSDLQFKYDQLAFNEIKVGQENIYDWAGPTQWLGVFYDPKVTDTTITWNRDNFIVSYTEAQVNEMLAGSGFTGSAATSFSGIKVNILSAIGAEWETNVSATQKGRYRRDVALDVSGSDITYGTYKFYTVNNNVTQELTGSINSTKQLYREAIANFNVDAWWNANQGLIAAYQINRAQAFNALRTSLDGKYVSYGGGIIKRIRFTNDSTTTNTYAISGGSDQQTLLNSLGLYGINSSIFRNVSVVSSNNTYSMRYTSQSIQFDVVSSNNITLTLPQRTTLDESFVRFACIPLNTPVKANGVTYPTLAADVVSALVTNGFALAGTGNSSFIKDIVRLPYCPIKPLNDLYSGQSSPTRSVIDLDALGSWASVGATITAPIMSGSNTIIGYCIEESTASQDYRLNNALNIQADRKERYYKKCRMRSPNHLSALEVSPAYNLGITDISLSFTLRALKTMYAISPVWKGLYGQMFKDDRFNITEGGFSYSQTTDLWADYQLTNSTYQDIFNTGIKSMEYTADARMSANLLATENSYNNSRIGAEAARERAIMSADLAAIQGFANAADDPAKGIMGVMGSMTARRSAEIGFKASMQQAANNLSLGRHQAAINDAIANNQIQVERDKFNLTNIAMRAAPTVMGRSSDFTVITAEKFYIEIYECLPIEKTFLDNFIKYNGELLEVITDDVKQYIVNEGDYMEGYCIYIPGLTPRMSEAVNAELRRGRYYALNIFGEVET